MTDYSTIRMVEYSDPGEGVDSVPAGHSTLRNATLNLLSASISVELRQLAFHLECQAALAENIRTGRLGKGPTRASRDITNTLQETPIHTDREGPSLNLDPKLSLGSGVHEPPRRRDLSGLQGLFGRASHSQKQPEASFLPEPMTGDKDFGNAVIAMVANVSSILPAIAPTKIQQQVEDDCIRCCREVGIADVDIASVPRVVAHNPRHIVEMLQMPSEENLNNLVSHKAS